MEYTGKLYGKAGGVYFDTGKTSVDWDRLEEKIKILDRCIILHQGKPLNNILFDYVDIARNYIKMKYSNRKFKEIEPNLFVCTRYGTTFKIVELNDKNIEL